MKHLSLVIVIFLNVLICSAQNGGPRTDENTFGALKARHIGPAVMSGRISAIDALHSDPRLIYVGSASGGLWKSMNGGVTFDPLFDEYNQSIGAIAIDQEHPDTVWAGTGEPWVRNTVSVGDGIYKTTDGGRRWKNMGLGESERIGRIIIHPEDPDIVFVAALGPLWSAGSERGLFRTTDGGATWEKILFVDEHTGCCDVAVDPADPGIVYAAMWEFRREPFFFSSGGPGSGLFISRDGGDTWSEAEGLSPKPLGRIALSASPVVDGLVYALVESEKSALYRSTDHGQSWKRMAETPAMGERPFYFSLIVADPVDSNRVYKPGFILNMSEDQGESFSMNFLMGASYHPDLHALWISSSDNKLLYLGTDGGLFISNDRGQTWRMARNLPLSQFYHVAVDNEIPYNVYGGLQDNGSWMGPSASPSGIQNGEWKNIGIGDGFNAFPDPYDGNLIYWQYQGGNIKRKYRNTLEVKDIKPFVLNGDSELRFNWNTPFLFSPARDVMYVGAQYLFRSYDKGDTWQAISPDLTTDDPEKQRQSESGGITIDNTTAENHCTISAIGESPVDTSIIWVGTDDGNLQVTENSGRTWTNVVSNISGLPAGTWCSSVCPGRFGRETAYVTFDGHRSGDMTPYIFKTEDLGKTWEQLGDQSLHGYCHKIIEDLEDAGLLFLGTESGLFISVDAGASWAPFRGNMPPVAVRDMVIHPREHDLILATHGRGVMIIDDITPVRKLDPGILDEDLVFLPGRPYKLGYTAYEMNYTGDDGFTGKNPPQSAMITYYMKKRHVFGSMFIEVFDEDGNRVKELPAGKRKGINRVPWAMRMKPPKVPASPQLAFQALYGPTYPPGRYTVRVTKGKEVFESHIDVVYDPFLPHSVAERDMRHEVIMKAYNLLEELAFLDNQVAEMMDQSLSRAKEANNKSLGARLDSFHSELEIFRSGLAVSSETTGITGEEKLREKLASLYGSVLSYAGKPTEAQVIRLNALDDRFSEERAKADAFVNERLPELNKLLEKENMDPIVLTGREEFFRED